MAFLELTFYSKALKASTDVSVILPEISKKEPGVGALGNTPWKTLYLLHGLEGNYHAWVRNSSIVRYAKEYGIAVVMPDAGRNWYADTARGLSYFTFITEELSEVCRSFFKGISSERENNYIAGLSMGGYGALKAALSYPDKYAGCASLSGSVDITRRMAGPIVLDEWRAIFGFDLKSAADLEGSQNDLFALARRNKIAGMPFPRMYLWCGTEDGLITANRTYHALLTELGIKHGYKESEGDHSWKWWDLHIQDALTYLFGDPPGTDNS